MIGWGAEAAGNSPSAFTAMLAALAPIGVIAAALITSHVTRINARKSSSDLQATLATLTKTLADLPLGAHGRESVKAAVTDLQTQIAREKAKTLHREKRFESLRIWLSIGVVGSGITTVLVVAQHGTSALFTPELYYVFAIVFAVMFVAWLVEGLFQNPG
ncbi:hypothetical protein ACFVUS_12595 [Nocardia sp. NPDC058058]|uniref:hypothetical protein n=1 Tax=Nocardia sp. NPDC058058 TaxID=3346317 RepID=UPI0036DF455A